MKDFGLTPPASKRPLQLCEGGCDSDSDCAGGLKCFQRTGLTPVPGCSGSGISDHDYCIFPELKDFGDTPSILPLQLCEGDCDNHSDCAGDLECFQRTGLTPVPGCSGSGISDHDYCISPELRDFGDTPPASKLPLRLCEGDCDTHSDCAGGLKCFQRTGLTPVPGCSGSGISDHDYCTIDAAAVNAAFGKIATQSSTLDQKSSALIAVDGITVGTKEEGSVSCTTPSSTMNQWWKVDLGATFDIDRIKIFNSSSLTYQLQLNKFTVQVLKDGKIVWSIFQEDAPRPDVTFTFPTSSIVGDEVKIVRNNKNGDGVIVLSEVEVYGTPTEAKAAMLKKEEEERVASISVGRGDLKMYFKNV